MLHRDLPQNILAFIGNNVSDSILNLCHAHTTHIRVLPNTLWHRTFALWFANDHILNGKRAKVRHQSKHTPATKFEYDNFETKQHSPFAHLSSGRKMHHILNASYAYVSKVQAMVPNRSVHYRTLYCICCAQLALFRSLSLYFGLSVPYRYSTQVSTASPHIKCNY